MKKQLTLYLMLVFGGAAVAQNTAPADVTPAKKGMGVSVVLSSNGIGAEVSKTITSNGKFVARLGGTYLSYDLKNYEIAFSSTKLVINGPVTLGSLGAYVDWHPFNNAIKVTGGVAYMVTGFKSNAVLKDSVKQGDISVSPNDVGKVNIEIKPASFAPYIGIGFGRAVPKNRVGVSFEVGTYYIGSPTINFTTTGMLEPTTNQGKVLTSNLKDYNWLPKLSFNINIRLTK